MLANINKQTYQAYNSDFSETFSYAREFNIDDKGRPKNNG